MVKLKMKTDSVWFCLVRGASAPVKGDATDLIIRI